MPMTVAAQAQASAAATSGRRARTSAEAARYSILRRLAPALKHDMVVNLQAVAMMAEVLNARLEKGSPAASDFEGSISKMNRLAREAVMTCLRVAAWIEPAEDESIRLREGVEECVSLLRSSLNFRGFSVENEVAETEFEVSRVAMRNLLAASLIALTDSAQQSCTLAVGAEVASGFAVLSLRCLPSQEEADAPVADPVYRELDWADVQALAVAEGVELFRTQDQIVMRIPRMLTSGPLQIAPL